ncbi:hypothetical protein SAMN02746041_00349 [Desulfacinum hydrothermale DSM 13146]|uniref:Lipoprotein n=1 Tax=Desulfacinum hydrothermale DSM 13146 TaxID=1121390 RepID=A0A1W1X113_9BACT|nr:hypothetical protein [Desulfacinum hydrothermale]SMC17587.1 hypothetical protein SAMN02746041_00349 [Desulfacinum hydrothermale DSM 13146]
MNRRLGIVVMGIALWSLSLGGCAWFQREAPAGTEPAQQPASTSAPTFYDFPDIPVPNELRLQSKESTVFQGGGVKTGLLVFKGRVDPSSVINFFQVSLAREKWRMKGSIRYRKSLLLFEKDDRFCIVNVYERHFYTYVEIYVVPTLRGM